MDFKNILEKYIFPSAVFCGGMIGVGFLSLPYIATRAGVLAMVIYFFVVTVLMLSLNIIFVKISLKTPDFKRFPGFAKYYLGRWGQALASICIVFGTIGVLLAYIIVGGEFLTNIFSPIFGGNNFIYTFLYFLTGSVIVFLGIRTIARVETLVLIGLIVCLVFIFLKNFWHIDLSNILSTGQVMSFKNLFLPFGPLVFSLWGVALIPEVEEMLIGKKKFLKKIIFGSVIAVAIFYFLFVVLIVGITGSNTTESALTGLKNFLGNGSSVAALFAGTLATFTAFIAQGIVLKKTLMFDLGVKHWQAFVMATFTPMTLFLMGFKSFISIVSFIGGVLLGIEGILILLMYKKIGGKKVVIYPLLLIFVLGIAYEIFYFSK